MTTYKRILWLAMVGMLLLAPAPVMARGTAPELPPLPEWPIIGPLLRAVGILPDEPSPAPTPTLDPDVPTYHPSTFQEGWDLWQELEAGEPVRVVIAEKDVNRALKEVADEEPETLDANVTFEEGTVGATLTLDRSLLEEIPTDIPFLPRGQSLKGEAKLQPGAEACRLTVKVKTVEINGRSLFLRLIMNRVLRTLLDEYWPAGSCLERVIVTEDTLTLEGYK